MNKKLIALYALAVVTGVLGYFIPTTTTQLTEFGYGVMFASASVMAVAAVFTIWFLVTSLKEFKSGSRIAYYIISAGILFYALAQIEQVTVALLAVYKPELVTSIWATSAFFLVPFGLSALGMFLGVRKLAGVLSVRTFWTSFILTMGLGIVTAGGTLLLPQTPTGDPTIDLIAKVIFATCAVAGSFALTATMVALHIKNTISSTYRRAMQWLAIGLGMMAFASFQEIIAKGTPMIDTPYVTHSLDIVPFLLAGLLFMQAGYAFKAATFTRLSSNATYIDSVLYAARLVSNPADIDQSLDDLRGVTSGLTDKSSLTPEQKETVLRVYLDIENYLETKEPMRNITKASLRERMTAEFQSALAAHDTSSTAQPVAPQAS